MKKNVKKVSKKSAKKTIRPTKAEITLRQVLAELGVCGEAFEWGKTQKSMKGAWDSCDRADWMGWVLGAMAYRSEIGRDVVIKGLAKAAVKACRMILEGTNAATFRMKDAWSISRCMILLDIVAAGHYTKQMQDFLDSEVFKPMVGVVGDSDNYQDTTHFIRTMASRISRTSLLTDWNSSYIQDLVWCIRNTLRAHAHRLGLSESKLACDCVREFIPEMPVSDALILDAKKKWRENKLDFEL